MPAKRYDQDTLERAAEMREGGATFKEIGAALNMSPSAASWHCLRLGADSPHCIQNVSETKGPAIMKRGNHIVRRFTAEDDATLLKMEADGASIAEMSRALNRRHNSIMGRLMTLARRDDRLEQLSMEGVQG